MCSRYGGEEFIFLLPEADKEAAFTLAERLRVGLGRIDCAEGAPPTISFGIASYPADASKLEDLVRLADAVLYRAKQEGRDRTVRCSPPARPITVASEADPPTAAL